MTASRLAKVQSRLLAPDLAKAASINVPRDGGACLAISAVIKEAQMDMVACSRGHSNHTRRAVPVIGKILDFTGVACIHPVMSWMLLLLLANTAPVSP